MGTLVSAAREVWAEGIRRVHAEAAGVVTLSVLQADDMPELLAHALMGDPEATRLAKLVERALQGIEQAPRRRPMLCGSCPRHLRNGRYSIACAIPHRDDPREAVVMGICRCCASDHAAIVRAAQRALKQLWPDLRTIDLHPGEGRA